jgi:hypothetical protein
MSHITELSLIPETKQSTKVAPPKEQLCIVSYNGKQIVSKCNACSLKVSLSYLSGKSGSAHERIIIECPECGNKWRDKVGYEWLVRLKYSNKLNDDSEFQFFSLAKDGNGKISDLGSIVGSKAYTYVRCIKHNIVQYTEVSSVTNGKSRFFCSKCSGHKTDSQAEAEKEIKEKLKKNDFDEKFFGGWVDGYKNHQSQWHVDDKFVGKGYSIKSYQTRYADTKNSDKGVLPAVLRGNAPMKAEFALDNLRKILPPHIKALQIFGLDTEGCCRWKSEVEVVCDYHGQVKTKLGKNPTLTPLKNLELCYSCYLATRDLIAIIVSILKGEKLITDQRSVYYVKFIHTDRYGKIDVFYKVGLSKAFDRNLKNRFELGKLRSSNLTVDVIDEIVLPNPLACILEAFILLDNAEDLEYKAILDKAKYKSAVGGCTETFKTNILDSKALKSELKRFIESDKAIVINFLKLTIEKHNTKVKRDDKMTYTDEILGKVLEVFKSHEVLQGYSYNS